MSDAKEAARLLGRLGGLSKSERKVAASRANGKKGGRPHHLRGGRPKKDTRRDA